MPLKSLSVGYVAKVGVGGSNPLARSSSKNAKSRRKLRLFVFLHSLSRRRADAVVNGRYGSLTVASARLRGPAAHSILTAIAG